MKNKITARGIVKKNCNWKTMIPTMYDSFMSRTKSSQNWRFNSYSSFSFMSRPKSSQSWHIFSTISNRVKTGIYIFIDFLTQLLALPLPSFSPLCHMIRHIRELTLMMASSPAVTKTASSGEAVMVVMGLVAAGRSASSEPSWRSQTSTDPSLPTVTISPLRRTLPPRNTTCAARV